MYAPFARAHSLVGPFPTVAAATTTEIVRVKPKLINNPSLTNGHHNDHHLPTTSRHRPLTNSQSTTQLLITPKTAFASSHEFSFPGEVNGAHHHSHVALHSAGPALQHSSSSTTIPNTPNPYNSSAIPSSIGYHQQHRLGGGGSYSPGAPPPQQLYSTTALHSSSTTTNAAASTTAAFQSTSAPGTIEDDPPALIGQPIVATSRPATNWQQQKKISLNTIERDPLPTEMSMRQQRQKQNSFGPAKADLRQLAHTYHLSDEVLKSYQEAFRIFDRNNDGCITQEELGTVMKSLGHQPSDNELQDMVNEVDVDGSGTIEFDEFVQMMSKRMEQKSDEGEDLKEAFEVFDRNKDGYITAEELRQVMRSLGENLTDQELNEMMKAADANGDGIINFNEFQEVWTEAQQLVMK